MGDTLTRRRAGRLLEIGEAAGRARIAHSRAGIPYVRIGFDAVPTHETAWLAAAGHLSTTGEDGALVLLTADAQDAYARWYARDRHKGWSGTVSHEATTGERYRPVAMVSMVRGGCWCGAQGGHGNLWLARKWAREHEEQARHATWSETVTRLQTLKLTALAAMVDAIDAATPTAHGLREV